jgi:hypothetical protein
MSSKDAPLAVEVPASTQDKPLWVKIGVIAAVGFVIGIAWPRLLGVRLGPSAPGSSESAAASASASAAHGGRAPDAPPATVVTKGPAQPSAVASTATPPTPVPPNITVQKGTVLSCKTTDGETKKGKDCGGVPGIDALVTPRVRKIATCSGVEGQTGKLSLVVNADFASGRFWYDVGKTSTVPNLDAVTSCLKTSFHGTSTTATQHEHPRYTVVYTATFTPGVGGGGDDDKNSAHKDKNEKDKSSKAAKETPSDSDKDPSKDEKPSATSDNNSTPATPPSNSGEAQVAWEVALVRDAPKTGGLVTRLPRGTKVKVGSSKDGWYQVKFGEGFANEGWVYRGAIGR